MDVLEGMQADLERLLAREADARRVVEGVREEYVALLPTMKVGSPERLELLERYSTAIDRLAEAEAEAAQQYRDIRVAKEEQQHSFREAQP